MAIEKTPVHPRRAGDGAEGHVIAVVSDLGQDGKDALSPTGCVSPAPLRQEAARRSAAVTGAAPGAG